MLINIRAIKIKVPQSLLGYIKEKLSKEKKLSDSVILKTQAKFYKVYKAFDYYNDNLNDSTVYNFVKICIYFNLDTNEAIFNQCIAQICCESRAKQQIDKENKERKIYKHNILRIS